MTLAEVKQFFNLLRSSIVHAWDGIRFATRAQRNLKIHWLFSAVAMALAGCLGFSCVEWVLLMVAIGLVLSSELVNTAFELLLDVVESRGHPTVKLAKDIAAGGVLITVIVSIFIGICLFGPYLWDFLGGTR